jgi:hypothetical protein
VNFHSPPMKEILLDEQRLLELLSDAGPGGQIENRYLYHILKQLHMMGASFRDEWKIVMFNGDHDGELSEPYAEYCDLLLQNKKVSFDAEQGEYQIEG